MIELTLTTNNEFLLWMMDDWTMNELDRAITRHRERRGFAPQHLAYNPKNSDKVSKLETGLQLRENKLIPVGYINLS